MATVREPRAREKVRRAPRLRGRLLVAGVLCVTAIAGVFALLGRPYRGALPPDTRVGGIERGRPQRRRRGAAAGGVGAAGDPEGHGADVRLRPVPRLAGADPDRSRHRRRPPPRAQRGLRRADQGAARRGRVPRPRPPVPVRRPGARARPAPRAARRRGGAGRSGREGRAERLAEGRPRQGRDPDRPRRAGGVAASAAAARRAPGAAAAAGAAVGRQRLGAARAGRRHDAADDAPPGGAARSRLPDPPRRAGEGARLRARGRGGAPEADAAGDPRRDAPAVRHGRGAAAERPVRGRVDGRGRDRRLLRGS